MVWLFVLSGMRSAEDEQTQEPEVQKLFEKSALVIIDVNDAIANGYVQLATDITDIMEGEADEE